MEFTIDHLYEQISVLASKKRYQIILGYTNTINRINIDSLDLGYLNKYIQIMHTLLDSWINYKKDSDLIKKDIDLMKFESVLGTPEPILNDVIEYKQKESDDVDIKDVINIDLTTQKLIQSIYGIRVNNTSQILNSLTNFKLNIKHHKIPVRVFNSKNYGDAISVFVIEKFFQIKVSTLIIGKWQVSEDHLMTIGSILNFADDKSLIWGSGHISKKSEIGEVYGLSGIKPKHVYSVRGPLTRDKLIQAGVSEVPELYGDPALLLPLIYQPPGAKAQYKYGLIPHYIDSSHELIREHPGVLVMNIESGDRPCLLVNQIMTVEIVISSSLHGLVVAVAYGKPCIWFL